MVSLPARSTVYCAEISIIGLNSAMPTRGRAKCQGAPAPCVY